MKLLVGDQPTGYRRGYMFFFCNTESSFPEDIYKSDKILKYRKNFYWKANLSDWIYNLRNTRKSRNIQRDLPFWGRWQLCIVRPLAVTAAFVLVVRRRDYWMNFLRLRFYFGVWVEGNSEYFIAWLLKCDWLIYRKHLNLVTVV